MVLSQIIKLSIDSANDNEVIFSLAKSSDSNSMLAMQEDSYWENISQIEED